MEKQVFSKIQPDKLLHIFYKGRDQEGRINIIPENQALQASFQSGYPAGHNFKGPHKHLPQKRETNTTLESWIVISGSLKVTMYDLDNSFLDEEILNQGDFYV